MKKILFAVALLSLGTTIVNALSNAQRDIKRENVERLGTLQPVRPLDTQPEFNGADQDELGGEEHEVTEAEVSY